MNLSTMPTENENASQKSSLLQHENDVLQLAMSKVKENALDEAIPLFNILLDNNSKHAPSARIHLLNIYKNKKDTENIIKLACLIIENEPLNVTATLALIDVAIGEKKYNDALNYCEDFEKKATNKTIKFRNSYIRRLLKDYTGSKKILTTILSEDPADPAALLQLSLVYFDTGEFESAIATAEMIQNASREYPASVIIIIDCLIKSEQDYKALEYIENYLSQGSATSQILHRQFNVFKKIGYNDKAKDLLDRTELTNEQKAKMAFELLKFYKTQYNLAEIEFCLNKIASLKDESEANSTLYAEALYVLNKQKQLFEFTQNVQEKNNSTDKLKLLHFKAKQLCFPEKLLKDDCYLLQENSDTYFNIYIDTLIYTGEIYQAYTLLTRRLETTSPEAMTLQSTFNLLCQLKLYEKAAEFIHHYKEFTHFLCKARVGYLLHVLYVLRQTQTLQQLLILLEKEKNDIFYPQILWLYAFMGQLDKAEQYYESHIKKVESSDIKRKIIQRESESFFNKYKNSELNSAVLTFNTQTTNEPFARDYLSDLLLQHRAGDYLLLPLELAVPKKITQQANESNINWYSNACRGATAYQLYTQLVSRDYTVNQLLTTQLSERSAQYLNDLSNQKIPCVFVSTHFGAPGALAVITEQIQKSLYLINPYIQLTTKNPLTEKAIAIDGSLENIRQLKSKIKAGYSLIGALDQRPEFASTKPINNTITVNVFGYSVEFSSLLPRMIWNNQLPNVWTQVRFNDGKAELFLADLPQVSDFDDQNAWQEAWLKACATEIEKMLKMDSNNCVPTAPLWKQLFNQVFAEDARQIAALPLPQNNFTN